MIQFSEYDVSICMYKGPARSACWRACERAAPGGALACEASGKLPSGPGGWWAAFDFELVLALSFMYSHHTACRVSKLVLRTFVRGELYGTCAWAAVRACLVLDGVVCLALSSGLSGCRASVLCVRVGCRAGPVLEFTGDV
jgi:hypothetical protein